MKDTRLDSFENRVWLSSPTMHGEELQYMTEAFKSNWMSTVGENIDVIEKVLADFVGVKYAVALSSGTAALHLAIRLAGEKLYGKPKIGHGSLENRRVFCSDLTFSATVNPITYEGGEPVFIDTELDSWNMDPASLQRAFEMFPDVKLIVVAHLYGTPAKMDRIRAIASAYGAIIVEDAAESLGATYEGKQAGSLGDYGIVSFNGNKIITGSSGGMFFCNDKRDAEKIKKWSTQSREQAAWYQHEEVGFNYRMSNVIAGVVRGQLPHLSTHIKQKKRIWNQYHEGLKDLPVKMNPIPDCCTSNYWLSCIRINKEAMCPQVRNDKEALFVSESGRTCPTEILNAIGALNAEGRPIWKPMHMHPLFRTNCFVGNNGDVGSELFESGLCLPSDNKMTEKQIDTVIEIVHNCFE